MTKSAIFISVLLFSLLIACDTTVTKQSKAPTISDSTTKSVTLSKHLALKFVDSFIAANSAINQNTALREHYESLCTKEMLPLIGKKGLYDDLPFKLTVTAMHNGTAYGNFVYDDDRHYVKVTCIIKREQLQNLQENSQYLIKFKTAKLENGVSFQNEFSKIEFPTVDAYLTSFTPVH